MKLSPMPIILEMLFKVYGAAFCRYVDIRKPMLLSVAQQTIRESTAHRIEYGVSTPSHMVIAEKKIKLGDEITSGAKANPRA